MLKVCEQSDNGESPPKEPATEIIKLKEEKVLLHDRTRNMATHVWYLDTGASNHMTGDMAQFYELNLLVGGMVRLGDERTVGIEGHCLV
jgi:hypothetical protein